MFNIYYNKELLYNELSEDECREKLMMLSEEAVEGVIDETLVEVEEV